MNLRSFLFASVAGAALFAAPALATVAPEDAPVSAEAPESGEQILVTARRRQESAQAVPLSISVVGGERIAAQGTYNIAKLTQIQPTLQFYTQNPRNTFINIRGIGAPFGLTNDGFEQGVGIYIDDVYYNRIASATLDFVDVQQIETLRGPQGTLYGKNTTAGAINITTRAPSFDFEAKGELSLGNYNFKQGKGTISGPITDNLAARVSVSATRRDGTIYNTATNQNIQSVDNFGVRSSVLWKPISGLNVTLSGDWNLQSPICCALPYYSYGATQRAANRQLPALLSYFPSYAGPNANPYARTTDVDAQLAARNEHGGLSARVVYDLAPSTTLTSVTAWRYWDWKPANDRDYTGLPVYTKVNNPTKQNQYTQEFRLNHKGNGFDFVLGLFAFHQKIRTKGIQEAGSAASKYLLNPTSSLSNNPAVLNGLLALNDIHLDNTSLAAFGKLNWDVTDRLTISPGIRLNYDEKDGVYNSVVTGRASDGTTQVVSAVPGSPYYTDTWTAAQRGVQASQYFEPKLSGWNLSYDVNVAYKLSSDVKVYANYARAFKSGGINLNGVPADANGAPILAAATIKPEKVNHYEVGIKTQFLNRRATFNVSGFWTDIEDFQANVSNAQFGTLRGYLANAKGVRSRGVEADFSVTPNEYLSAYLSGAFTDAIYTNFCDAPAPPELSGGSTTLTATGACTYSGTPGAAGVAGGASPPFVNASGQALPGVSKWAFSWGGEAKSPVQFIKNAQIYFGYDASYRSTWSSNPTPSIYTWVKGYALHNFRTGVRTDKIDAFIWARNAFNANYAELLLAGTGGNTGLIAGQVGDPRTFGATVKFQF